MARTASTVVACSQTAVGLVQAVSQNSPEAVLLQIVPEGAVAAEAWSGSAAAAAAAAGGAASQAVALTAAGCWTAADLAAACQVWCQHAGGLQVQLVKTDQT